MEANKNTFVEKLPNGTYRLVTTDGEHPLKGGKILAEQTISEEQAKKLQVPASRQSE